MQRPNRDRVKASATEWRRLDQLRRDERLRLAERRHLAIDRASER
jgi:hypothetical protein